MRLYLDLHICVTPKLAHAQMIIMNKCFLISDLQSIPESQRCWKVIIVEKCGHFKKCKKIVEMS